MNTTQLFLGEPDSWFHLQIRLSALQALWDGWVIAVSGDRTAILQHVSPARIEQRYKLKLTDEEFRGVLQACIERDVLDLPAPTRPGQPDETMIELALVNALGLRRSVSKWAGERSERFEAVSRPLFALTLRTQGLEPFQSGPFEWPGVH